MSRDTYVVSTDARCGCPERTTALNILLRTPCRACGEIIRSGYLKRKKLPPKPEQPPQRTLKGL